MRKKSLKILLPIYVPVDGRIKNALKHFLRGLVSNLDVRIDITQLGRRFTTILIDGNDAEAVSAFLSQEFGTVLTWEDIKFNREYRGFVRSIGENSLYVDIGLIGEDYFKVEIRFRDFISCIFNIEIEVQKIKRDTFDLFGIRQYFPLYVLINLNENIDEKNRILRGCLSERTCKMFRNWINLRLDKLIVYGTTKTQVEKAIKVSRHFRDVIRIERLGFLEHVITFKWNTSAKGMIKELGPFLPRVSLAPFYPRMIHKAVRSNSR